MGLICVVCLQSLISDPDPAASLSCGHIFHSTCIYQCLQASDHCPLCKKKVSRSKMVSPLYFSTGSDDEDQTNASGNSSELHSRVKMLSNENKQFLKTVAELTQELSNVKKERAVSESQLNRVTKSMRYLKQIRRVAELDDSLASPTSQSYMKRLQQLPASDLLVTMGALEQRFKDATKERNEAVQKLSGLKKDNLHLTKKVERLQQKLKESSSTTSTIPPRVRRYHNVINLDSEDEDEEEDEDEDDIPYIQNNDISHEDQQLNTPSPPTILSESVESLSANEESSATSEPHRISRQLSILSDNDLEFAVEEHTTVRNPYNLKRRNDFIDRSIGIPKRARNNNIIIDDQE